MDMISISDLCITFKEEEIYKNFFLSVKKGDKIAITGESGKGKSTLLNLLAGFIPNFKGNVSIDGLDLSSKNICEIRKKLAWLPQETALKLMTVNDLFYTPFHFAHNKAGYPGKEQVSEIFSAFELDEALLGKKVKQISGGQKQRIILAACVLQNKPIMLLDEPSSALDPRIKKRVTDHILGTKDSTILAVTHDEYWMEQSDRIIHLGGEEK